MTLTLNIFAFTGLLCMIFYITDRLLGATVAISRLLHISPFLASVFILGFGTSSPEYAVSTLAAIRAESLLAIGNVFGSNITNLTLVVGCCTLLGKVCMSSTTLKQRFTVVLISTILPGIFFSNLYFGRWEAVVLLIFFVALMYYMKRVDSGQDEPLQEGLPATRPGRDVKHPWAEMVVALIALLICCNLLLSIAIDIAQALHLSTLVIGITIVAFGSSLPELVSALVSIYRKRNSMAMGTILGSNVFNSFAIFGTIMLIHPSRILPEMMWRDFMAMFVATLLLWSLFVFSRDRCLRKGSGLLLLVYFIAYIILLLTTASPPQAIDL